MQRRHVAGALFFCTSATLVGFWCIYLFVGIPEHQSAAEHAVAQLVFSFTRSGAVWHFSLLAFLPFAFGFLAVAAWRLHPRTWRPMSWSTVLAVLCAALLLLVLWEAVLFAAPATCLAVSQGSGKKG